MTHDSLIYYGIALMPELPEVETIVRGIAPRLAGRRILSAEFLSPLVLRHCADPDPELLRSRIIRTIERRGKFIVMELDRGSLVIHLGMTGRLLFDTPRTPYTRAVFTLEDGSLVYEDIRQFGSIEWSSAVPSRVGRLGPEPFEISPEDFSSAMRRRKAPVKAVLLNQSVIRGMGNIYTDEALFRAQINPRARANRLSRTRAFRLHASVIEVLLDAIEHRGSSVSDYVDAAGLEGGFQLRHQVYGREGEPCPRCKTAIRRIVVAQRGTHYCPKCQR
ncbi:MAG: bifunctional DNA-formamidopyrimidine glycosylase/DNA-(apurinic or apyrimidinic site) lyase [Bryobacteraceae bacterium]